MMKTLDMAGDLRGHHVLLRADFDVPITDGSIADVFRTERQKVQLQQLLDAGARVVVIAHITATDSFTSLQSRLEEILDVQFTFLRSPEQLGEFWDGGEPLALLENLRSWPGEEADAEEFAQKLAHGADIFVNNAFAVCHRAHASVAGIARILPSYAGELVVREVQQLASVISAPAEGKVIFVGGAKGATKAPVIRNLIGHAQYIAVGGVVANDILKERGVDIDASQSDANSRELLEGVDIDDTRLLVPEDHVKDNGSIVDIGPQTAQRFADAARSATLAVWNGPMGKFEDERFNAGTRILAEAMAASSGFTVIGGGDTIAAVSACGIPLEKFDFISTGGGAMLAFLAGQAMPGLEALGYTHA